MTLREFFDRYGPTTAVIIGLALLIALLPGDDQRTVSATGVGTQGQERNLDASDTFSDDGLLDELTGTEGDEDGGGVVTGGNQAGGSGGGNAAGGGGGGTAQVRQGQGQCRPDGRQAGISKYMPPCVDFSGGNGGATARGVTGERILVIRYINQVDPATRAILQQANLADDPAVVDRVYESLRRYANHHYQTYGREVVFQRYDASGPDESDEAMKADALKIAQDLKAFAVITLGPKVLGQELARRGVVCICTVSLSSEFYQENPPYMFGSLPTSTEYAIQIGEYIGKRVAGQPAKYAGPVPAGMTTRERRFGLIYLEGVRGKRDIEGKRARDAFVRELGRYGVRISAEYAYMYDPGRNQNDVSGMIAAMKGEGITTILMWVDPLYPILITTEATRQTYFPEWFITGSGLSDTSAAGRLYDQNQWRRAFGVSPLWVTWVNVATSAGYREFHHGMPGMRPGDEGVLINVYRAPVQSLWIGIHMAGPQLTADTFAQGMFNYPRTGGSPGAPLVFRTRAFPTEIKDFAEVYYDVNAPGRDERGQQGSGMVMKSNGGRRYLPGQWPRQPAQVFGDAANPIAVSDQPAGDRDPVHEQDGHRHTGRCMSCS